MKRHSRPCFPTLAVLAIVMFMACSCHIAWATHPNIAQFLPEAWQTETTSCDVESQNVEFESKGCLSSSNAQTESANQSINDYTATTPCGHRLSDLLMWPENSHDLFARSSYQYFPATDTQ